VRFMGVDVATMCGWAVVDKPSRGKADLFTFSVCNMGNGLAACHATMLAAKALEWKVRLVGLEEPYLGENPRSLKVLARLVGRFEQAFGEAGIPTMLVPAQTWQTAVLGRFGGMKREERKKACRIWAKAMFGLDLDEDAADAAGLAYHLATRRP